LCDQEEEDFVSETGFRAWSSWFDRQWPGTLAVLELQPLSVVEDWLASDPTLDRASAFAAHVCSLSPVLDRANSAAPYRLYDAFCAVIEGLCADIVLTGELDFEAVRDGQIVYRSNLHGLD
jgi:hypothetical protein